MGKTYRYNSEKYGDNYNNFRRFKKEMKQKEDEQERELEQEPEERNDN